MQWVLYAGALVLGYFIDDIDWAAIAGDANCDQTASCPAYLY